MSEILSVNTISYNSVISGSRKLYVPVQPFNVMYTQFDHVSGVAAKPDQQGISVSKAQILNSLINQLASMKAQKLEQAQSSFSADAANDAKQIDALISDFQSKLQTTMQVAEVTGYGLAGASPDVGVLFAIDV